MNVSELSIRNLTMLTYSIGLKMDSLKATFGLPVITGQLYSFPIRWA